MTFTPRTPRVVAARRVRRCRSARRRSAAAAGAHVTLQPDQAPAGGFTRLDVRVPNDAFATGFPTRSTVSSGPLKTGPPAG